MIPAWIDGRLQPVEKLEAHTKGLRHKAVSVFIQRGDTVLLQRRALGKYHTPGLWANTCCTHPDWDEAPDNCATRRLEEELGITGVTPAWKHVLEYRADVGGGMIEHEVVDVFTAHVQDLEVSPNSDEVMDIAWVEIDVLAQKLVTTPERFTPWLQISMRDHAAEIFGMR